MVSYSAIYVLAWGIVSILYGLSWSSLNLPLDGDLSRFLLISISIALLISICKSKETYYKLHYRKRKKPTITFLLTIGYVLDWGYRGTIPIMSVYGSEELAASGGLPIIHVLITGVTIFYGMYLCYLILSDRRKSYILEFILILILLFLNSSRGYIVFIAIVALFMFMILHKRPIMQMQITVILGSIAAIFSIILFISMMGNIRYGYSWNDCSFIESIGLYGNYPQWLSKHFMWTYSYSTSPLANLNLNIIQQNTSTNLLGFVLNFLPQTFTQDYLSVNTVQSIHMVDYFNADSGFAPFYCSFGVAGLYISFIVLMLFAHIVCYVMKRLVVIKALGEAVMAFLVLVTIFYNPFASAAVCYLPVLLLVASLYLKHLLDNGTISLEEVDSK